MVLVEPIKYFIYNFFELCTLHNLENLKNKTVQVFCNQAKFHAVHTSPSYIEVKEQALRHPLDGVVSMYPFANISTSKLDHSTVNNGRIQRFPLVKPEPFSRQHYDQV